MLLGAILLCLLSTLSYGQKWAFGVEPSGKNMREGIKDYDEGKYSSAIKKFEKVHKNDTNYPLAIYERIITHNALKEYEKGVKVAEEAIRLNNDYLNMYYSALGTLYDDMDSTELSIATFDKAIELFPRDYGLQYNKAITLQKMERYKESIELVQEIIKANPEYPTPHYLLGQLCAAEGLYSQSIMSLTTYLILNPLGIYNSGIGGSTALSSLSLLDQVSSNSVDFEEPEDEDEKERIARRDLSFMNAGYDDMDRIIQNGVILQQKYKTKSKIDFNLVKQVHYVIHNRKQYQTKGFWEEFYGPYFDKIIAEKSFPDLMMLICVTGNSEKFNKKNEKKILAFYKKNSDDWSEMHCKLDIELDGETKKLMHHFSGSTLEGVGTLKDDEPVGNWWYFHKNGKISSEGKRNDKGERIGTWTWYYPNGIIKEVDNYKNGNLDGEVSLYREIGTLSYKSTFKDDKVDATREYYAVPGFIYGKDETRENNKEGMVEYFFANGQTSYSVKYKNDEKTGPLKRYYSDGELYLEENYKSNKRDGKSTRYNRYGVIVEEEFYKDGERDGENKEYYANGELHVLRVYDDGNLQSEKSYYYDGTLEEEMEFNDEGDLDGTFKGYDVDGKIHYEIVYEDDKPQSYKYFDKNGDVIKEGKLKKRELKFYGYYPSGEKNVVGTFENGNKDGTWKYYARGGWLTSEEKFSDGELDGVLRTYYPNGEVKSKTTYKDGLRDGKYEGYFTNGVLRVEGYYVEGESVGEWRYFHANGKKNIVNYFMDDEAHGIQEYYTTNGVKYQESHYVEDYIMKILHFDTSGNITKTIDVLKENQETIDYWNGKRLKEVNYKYCQLDGDIKWYYPNGQVEVEGQYQNDSRDGKWLSYFEDGKLSKIRHYRLGDSDSTWVYYYPNGQIKQKIRYVNGVENGKREYFYDNGKLHIESNVVNGSYHGVVNYYNKEGILSYSKWYKHGELMAYISPNGDTTQISSGLKTITFKLKNGKTSAIIDTKNGLYHGVFKLYYSNGKLQKEHNYSEGESSGVSIDYYKTGKKEKEAVYLADNLDGIHTTYFPTGKKKVVTNYIYGNIEGERVYYKSNGQVEKTYIYYNNSILAEK